MLFLLLTGPFTCGLSSPLMQMMTKKSWNGWCGVIRLEPHDALGNCIEVMSIYEAHANDDQKSWNGWCGVIMLEPHDA
jgi:hypothetical protein